MSASKKIIIVGGVAGGASVAARARRLSEDAHIIVVERGHFVSYANCGLPFHIGGEIPDRDSLLVQTPQGLRNRFNLDVRTESEAVRIDPTNQLLTIKNLTTGETYDESYDDLVLAPGAKPLSFPIPGIDRAGHFVLREIPDMDRIIAWNGAVRPRRATVVGAGYVGLEVAEQLTRLGISVTVIEARSQVLAVIDEDMAFWAQRQLEDHHVDVRLDTMVTSFEDPLDGEDAAASVVVCNDGSRIPTDLVVLSMGVKPEVDLAVDAGLEIGEFGGIRVNQHMRTSDEHIWAVGDAIEVRNPITREWSCSSVSTTVRRPAATSAMVSSNAPGSMRPSCPHL